MLSSLVLWDRTIEQSDSDDKPGNGVGKIQ